MVLHYTADGTVNPAAGARGGGPGGRTRALKRELDGQLTKLPACYGLQLEPGEYAVSYSAGGGGYGSPLQREPERVLRDLEEGWITRERAETVYGLVLNSAGRVDAAATQRRRAELRGG